MATMARADTRYFRIAIPPDVFDELIDTTRERRESLIRYKKRLAGQILDCLKAGSMPFALPPDLQQYVDWLADYEHITGNQAIVNMVAGHRRMNR